MTTPSNSTLYPESCISLASSLRCHWTGTETEIHHFLLIIPVVLELIFSSSLIFTNWRSGRRHLLIVAEGWVVFLLSLAEVLLFGLSAVRENILIFRSIDQAIGALSFIQLTFYMSFLYAWVRAECLPLISPRFRRLVRLLLLAFIPAVIATNTVASFVGVRYWQGRHHIDVTFQDERGRFIWLFFSSLTIALFLVFQASCFCFAFFRLTRAFLIQRNIEKSSSDAAVMFHGIGWINAGIKIGAIETVIAFVFFGVPIAYVRRSLRMLSRALLSIGIAKGVDAMEDFKAIFAELEYHKHPRTSRLRRLISNPRLSTFRQLSPTAVAFHAAPRAPQMTLEYGRDVEEKGTESFLSIENEPLTHQKVLYSPPNRFNNTLGLSLASNPNTPKPTTTTGLPGMAQFAEIRAKRQSQQPTKRVTVYYHQGTPKLRLRLSAADLPTPAEVAESIKSRTTKHTRSSTWGNLKERSRYSANSVESMGSLYSTSAEILQPSITKFEPPKPAYLNESRRLSYYSDTSGLSADAAEIVSTPRRKVSIAREKSSYAKAVLFPNPSTKVAMALTGSGNTSATIKSDTHRKNSNNEITYPALAKPSKPASPRALLREDVGPAPSSTLRVAQPAQQTSVIRESIIDEDGNVIVFTPIDSIEGDGYDSEDNVKRSTRAVSEYSVGSISETLQAVRELGKKFPGLPAGAVIANIGLRASAMTPVTERDEDSTEGSHSRDPSHTQDVLSTMTEETHGTTTDEIITRWVPDNLNRKAGPPPTAPSAPLPPLPGQQVQLPSALPSRKADIRRIPSQVPFTAKPIDPFDDDSSYHGTTDLSPLSMSIRLRHPRSFTSTLYSGSVVTSPISANSAATPSIMSYYAQSQSNGSHEGATSPEMIDFGAALNDWNQKNAAQKFGGAQNLHRRSVSNQTGVEYEKLRRKQQRPQSISSVVDSVGDVAEQRSSQVQAATTDAPLNRFKSFGKAPRRITPQPTRGRYVRGSMHLQPLVIPVSSSRKDVPISAVGASGEQTVLGVDKAGMNVDAAHPEDYVEDVFSASTEGGTSIVGRGLIISEALSVEDGGFVPIRLQGSRSRKGMR